MNRRILKWITRRIVFVLTAPLVSFLGDPEMGPEPEVIIPPANMASTGSLLSLKKSMILPVRTGRIKEVFRGGKKSWGILTLEPRIEEFAVLKIHLPGGGNVYSK